jgi:hypothetical protein
VTFARKRLCKNPLASIVPSSSCGHWFLLLLNLVVLPCGLPAPVLAQSQQPPATTPNAETGIPDQQLPATIKGTILDRNGNPVSAAHVTLTREAPSPNQEFLTADDGQFSFANLAPGPFQLTVTATGFSSQSSSGTLRPGENCVVPQMTLEVATAVTEVRVELSPIELAQEQMKDEIQQRVLGFIPNFYVSYVPDAAPLTSKQKFELAWRTSIDPVTFAVNGAVAGIEQAQDRFPGYGQGAEGYAKRYGASYADFLTSTFIGGAILPSLLKQDPRYFYKGTGTKRSRFLYAIANSVICKGDNGRWQTNYSFILGSLAAGGISNLYYPPEDRNGVGLTFENALIGIGATAAANVLQEFVIRKLTPNAPKLDPATP